MEHEYTREQVRERRPILAFIVFFDLSVYLFRLLASRASGGHAATVPGLLFQIGNMLALYGVVTFFNWCLNRDGAQVHPCTHLRERSCLMAVCRMVSQIGTMLALDGVVTTLDWCCNGAQVCPVSCSAEQCVGASGPDRHYAGPVRVGHLPPLVPRPRRRLGPCPPNALR